MHRPDSTDIDIERSWPRVVTVDKRLLKMWWSAAVVMRSARESLSVTRGAAPAPRRWAERCQQDLLGIVQAHHVARQAHPASFDDCCDWERGACSGVYFIVSDMLVPVDAEYVAEAVAVECIESAAGDG